ncbi:hypothetical protein [Massilia genomosp. 1]|uniref:Uncharacterized protein n=1 Tax=Massilia genomosp. 1 TaxID=2609280 RepID=A0ABX0MN19_9BURK|nr:hypothetical protein [Massilia genomosp. 1]NHZ64172.1 hypothetical protein [Massilia genomosp. 1]
MNSKRCCVDNAALWFCLLRSLPGGRSDRRRPHRGAALLTSYGRRDPAAQEKLMAMFAKEQIYFEFLLHYEPEEPFSRLKYGIK